MISLDICMLLRKQVNNVKVLQDMEEIISETLKCFSNLSNTPNQTYYIDIYKTGQITLLHGLANAPNRKAERHKITQLQAAIIECFDLQEYQTNETNNLKEYITSQNALEVIKTLEEMTRIIVNKWNDIRNERYFVDVCKNGKFFLLTGFPNAPNKQAERYLITPLQAASIIELGLDSSYD